MAYVRLFISIVATYGRSLHQLDIKNVFLHSDLQEEEHTLGYVAQGESAKVCCLQKSLYDLKQRLQAWFGQFCEVIQGFSLQKSSCDHSIFYKHLEVGMILLVVYVEDIVITRNDDTNILALKSFLHT